MGISIDFLLAWFLSCAILTALFFKCLWSDFEEDGMKLRDLLTALFLILTPALNTAVLVVLFLILVIEKTECVFLKVEEAISRVIDKKIIKPKNYSVEEESPMAEVKKMVCKVCRCDEFEAVFNVTSQEELTCKINMDGSYDVVKPTGDIDFQTELVGSNFVCSNCGQIIDINEIKRRHNDKYKDIWND
jgi:predicted RNA-binding Zn-ribbon protein involved in translation (DUF1610 family)